MFTSDVALAMLQHMDDKSLFVKVRASWTLANLCDALVLEHQNNEDFSIKDTLSLELWCKVTSAAASAANDNDKVRYLKLLLAFEQHLTVFHSSNPMAFVR